MLPNWSARVVVVVICWGVLPQCRSMMPTSTTQADDPKLPNRSVRVVVVVVCWRVLPRCRSMMPTSTTKHMIPSCQIGLQGLLLLLFAGESYPDADQWCRLQRQRHDANVAILVCKGCWCCYLPESFNLMQVNNANFNDKSIWNQGCRRCQLGLQGLLLSLIF